MSKKPQNIKNEVNIISHIIKLLQTDKFYGVSDNIEIAKGKFEIPRTLGEVFQKLKRTAKITWSNNGKRV